MVTLKRRELSFPGWSISTPAIFRLALKMLGREQDAEDVLQETFLGLRSIHNFESAQPLDLAIPHRDERVLMVLSIKPACPMVEVDREEDEEGSKRQLKLWIGTVGERAFR
jgi:hypothetical protein